MTNTNLNIETVIAQLNTAARNRQISDNDQRRVLRRLGQHEDLAIVTNWVAMMNLLREIDATHVRPVVLAQCEAAYAVWGTPYLPEGTKAEVVSKKLDKPEIPTEYDANWWKACELREREDRKAETLLMRAVEKEAKQKARDARRGGRIADYLALKTLLTD